MTIGNKIKMLRLKKGVTQEMMAQELCLSSQAVSKWENNVCAPDLAMLPKLSVYFGVTIDELFDMTAEQRLHRIEHMLDMEETLSEADFKETISFLKEELEMATQKANRDEAKARSPQEKEDKDDLSKYLARLYSILAHTYHHRMASDGRKVSEYARKSMRLAPDVKSAQWLLEASWTWVFEAKIAIARFDPELAFQKLQEMEALFPDDPDVLFQIGNFYAKLCRYDEAISYYEKSWEKGAVPRYYDALESEAVIYEIQENYEQALKCWDRIRENLEQEWKVYEGAPLQKIRNEKNRLLNQMQ